MGASAIIAGRETLEASLLVGFLLAYLAQTGNRAYFASVWLGVVLAAVVSVGLAVVIFLTLGGLSKTWEEAFEGGLMWGAAGFLTYVLWWMGHQSRELTRSLKTKVQTALTRGSAAAIATIAFLAVLREGAETVLYLSAVAATSPTAGVAIGAALGFGGAALAGFLIYKGGSRFLDVQAFFKVTTLILLVFAAGMVGKATLAFQAAGIFPGTISVWDTSGFLVETRGVGAILNTLVGYTASPSLLQVIFVLAYIGLIGTLYLDSSKFPKTDVNHEPFSPIGKNYQATLYRIIRWPKLTTVIPALMVVLFIALIIVAVANVNVGPFNNEGMVQWGPLVGEENENNLFNFVIWIIWIPLLILLTAVLGRIWCGNLCPLRVASDWGRSLGDRLTGKKPPATPYLNIGWLLPTSFILITLFVKWWPIQVVALYGAILFLILTGMAVVVGFLFRQGTWCRYICPIGGWLARIARLSPLGLRPDPAVCITCIDKPCLKGTVLAGRCPSYLNPPKLESNRNCLKCWRCVINCPPEKASMKLGWRFPGVELMKPYAPDIWESIFVASLLGMYVAVGHRSPELAQISWPLIFFGMMALATAAFFILCAIAAPLAGISFKRALTTLGYIFLPLEFSTAIISFGDDALEFFGVVQPVAAVFLTVGFVWSVILGVSILRNQSRSPIRAIASGVPVGAVLLLFLFVWLQWYASGTVIDLT